MDKEVQGLVEAVCGQGGPGASRSRLWTGRSSASIALVGSCVDGVGSLHRELKRMSNMNWR